MLAGRLSFALRWGVDLLVEDLFHVAHFLFDDAVDSFGGPFVFKLGVVGGVADLLLDSSLYFVDFAFHLVVGAGGWCCGRCGHLRSPLMFILGG